jgi:response regulator NasT
MLRVILTDHHQERTNELRAMLEEQGHEIVDVLASAKMLKARVSDLCPDVILVAMQAPGHDGIGEIRRLLQEYPCPVVLYEGIKDSRLISETIDAGISAYLTDDIRNRDVAAILQLAIARFRKFRTLQDELDSARERLEERKSVDRAKALLIKHHGLDEERAHHTLQQLAMKQRISLSAAAKNVSAMLDVLPA